MPLPPCAIGRVAENRVIEALIIHSGGDIDRFRPVVDDEGTALRASLRHRRGTVALETNAPTQVPL